MRAAKAGHAVRIARIAFAHEKVGRIFHQVFGVEGVDCGELFPAKADGKSARGDGDRRIFLADDEDGSAGIRCICCFVGKGGRGERKGKPQRKHGYTHDDYISASCPRSPVWRNVRSERLADRAGDPAGLSAQAEAGGPRNGGRICSRRRVRRCGSGAKPSARMNASAGASSTISVPASDAIASAPNAQG